MMIKDHLYIIDDLQSDPPTYSEKDYMRNFHIFVIHAISND